MAGTATSSAVVTWPRITNLPEQGHEVSSIPFWEAFIFWSKPYARGISRLTELEFICESGGG